MTKPLDSILELALTNNNIAAAYLVKIEFANFPAGFLRVTNSGQDLYWNEDGGGFKTYTALGELLSISSYTETTEVGANNFTVTLSGVNKDIIQTAISAEYIGKSIKVWFALLDTETYDILSEPISVVNGKMDYMNIVYGENSQISINVTSRLADWERQHGGRYTKAYQQTYVDPLDTGFDHVIGLQKLDLIWGGYTGPTGVQTGTASKCFAKDTPILMEDGSSKFIQDIELGDIVFFGGKVLSKSIGIGSEMNWYKYNNIKLTGSHMVLDQVDNIWKDIYESSLSINIEPESFCYYINTEKAIIISYFGDIFADINDIPYSSKAWDSWDLLTKLVNNSYTDRNKKLIQIRESIKKSLGNN